MLKGLKHVPLDPKYINQESLYLCVDDKGNWRVGGFDREWNFVIEPLAGWFGVAQAAEYKVKWHELRELYQMIVPRGFVRDGFSKIKVKHPRRNKNQPKPKKKPARVLDLGRYKNPPEPPDRPGGGSQCQAKRH